MNKRYSIELPDSTGRNIPAVLRLDLEQTDLERADASWLPEQNLLKQVASQSGISIDNLMQHDHWIWSRKWLSRSRDTIYGGIEAEDQLQGIMILRTNKLSRHESQQGLPLVYVDYLATAPWNNSRVLKQLNRRERFKKIARYLMRTAIRISQENQWEGRIGLLSLPQSQRYYQDRCGMVDLGEDPLQPPMHYFEMTPEIAAAFLVRED